MKTTFLWVLILLAQTFCAQDLTGSWKGEIDLGAMKLPLVLDIKKENNQYISTAKSPKQSDKMIKVDKTDFANNELFFEMIALNASYKGVYKTDHFEGVFTQNGQDFPLHIFRNNDSNQANPKDQKIKDIGNREINTAKIDNFLNYISDNKQDVGSLSIFRNGKEIYHKNFGQDQLSNVKWNAETGYQIGSISKLFTAVMLMQLAEKGKFNINDKLSKYYPEIPNADKITMESVLNHTSGLGDYVGSHYQWLFKKAVGDKAILDTIKAQGIEFQPGEKTRYSNSGYYLLSRILEKIYNKPYNVILKENITAKNAMKNTFSVLDNPKNVFKSYEKKDGKWAEVEDFDFHNCIGLGDIVSTTYDLNLFINALFNHKLVKKETLNKMLPKPEKPFDFGLGIMAVPFYNQVSFGHGGDTAGSHSITSYNLKDNYSVSIVVNGEEFPHNDLSIGILSLIYDTGYEYPKFGNDKEIPVQFQKYIGDYTSYEIPLTLKIFSQDQKLFAQAKGQSSFPLEQINKDEFKFDPAKIRIVFSVNQLQLLQDGATYHFSKK